MTYNLRKSAVSQERYCELAHVPLFAPRDGRCSKCHENIYRVIITYDKYGNQYTSGIDTKTAENTHITGCPHCHATFCD